MNGYLYEPAALQSGSRGHLAQELSQGTVSTGQFVRTGRLLGGEGTMVAPTCVSASRSCWFPG